MARKSKPIDMLAAALDELRSTTRELVQTSQPSPPSTAAKEDELYYRRLEASGELRDLPTDGDLNSLPPTVTHIRQPDGTIARIGFSKS